MAQSCHRTTIWGRTMETASTTDGRSRGFRLYWPWVPHPTEVAAAAAFFGSPEASYVTGQHIGINGGMAMLEPNMRMRRASPGQL
jgi:NAD(P)-dependent dehydrogenase (short-subunit alcohol dehydrogenase family)